MDGHICIFIRMGVVFVYVLCHLFASLVFCLLVTVGVGWFVRFLAAWLQLLFVIFPLHISVGWFRLFPFFLFLWVLNGVSACLALCTACSSSLLGPGRQGRNVLFDLFAVAHLRAAV